MVCGSLKLREDVRGNKSTQGSIEQRIKEIQDEVRRTSRDELREESIVGQLYRKAASGAVEDSLKEISTDRDALLRDILAITEKIRMQRVLESQREVWRAALILSETGFLEKRSNGIDGGCRWQVPPFPCTRPHSVMHCILFPFKEETILFRA